MPTRHDLTLAIVIPLRNQLVYTQQCLKSLRKYTKTDYGIVWVDNGCKDESIAWVTQYCQKNGIKFVVVDATHIRANLSQVWNLGIKRAQTWSPKYIAVINNDVLVYRKWWDQFHQMFEVADDKAQIWCAVPRFTRVEKPVDWEMQAEKALADNRASMAAQQVGFFMVFRAHMFDPQVIGYFDERFRLWFGDTDMYMRLAEAGHKVVQLYSVLIHHFESKTLNDPNPLTPLPDREGIIREDEELFNTKYEKTTVGADGKDDRPGVAIAVPHMGQMRAELAQLLLSLQAAEPRYSFTWLLAGGMSFHDYARNMIVEEFLKTKAEWLVMVDADILPPRNFLNMLEHPDAKVVGAVCHIWANGQLQATVYSKNEATGHYETRPDVVAFSGLVETPVTGTGCLAIHRSVFDKLKKPYFTFEYDPLTRARTKGEDIYFCEQITKAGFKIFVDTNIVCNHMKEIGMYGIFKMTNEYAKQTLRTYDRRKRAAEAAGKSKPHYHTQAPVSKPAPKLAPPQQSADNLDTKVTRYGGRSDKK